MEDYNISNLQITASSEFDSAHASSNARLNFNPASSNIAGSWSAAGSDVEHPWLQVDFQEKVTVTKVATQGRLLNVNRRSLSSYYQWVESFSLNYSLDGVDFEAYEQFGNVKVIYLNSFLHKVDCNLLNWFAIYVFVASYFVLFLIEK